MRLLLENLHKCQYVTSIKFLKLTGPQPLCNNTDYYNQVFGRDKKQ